MNALIVAFLAICSFLIQPNSKVEAPYIATSLAISTNSVVEENVPVERRKAKKKKRLKRKSRKFKHKKKRLRKGDATKSDGEIILLFILGLIGCAAGIACLVFGFLNPAHMTLFASVASLAFGAGVAAIVAAIL